MLALGDAVNEGGFALDHSNIGSSSISSEVSSVTFSASASVSTDVQSTNLSVFKKTFSPSFFKLENNFIGGDEQ